MKIDEEFDCVQMKREIQAKLLKERATMTEQQWRRRSLERILDDPVLGRIWRNSRRTPQEK